MQTRAGTDALAQAVRLLTDTSPELVLISLDGVRAFDHVRRAEILKKLMAEPRLQSLVPYVRQWYSRQSHYLWTDESGVVHDIMQGEGGEQGDPLMPALFALAQHESLVKARARLHADDYLFAFLDDLYVVTTRERAKAAFAAVTEEVAVGAGVRTHLGKLRLWSKSGGDCPAGFEGYGPDVWAGGAEPQSRGIKVLGTPLGHPDFVAAQVDKRVADERRFLDKLTTLADVQSAWLLLSDTSAPDTTAPDTIAPDTIAPDTTAPDTTAGLRRRRTLHLVRGLRLGS